MSLDPAVEAALLAHPLHRYMGLESLEAADGRAAFEIVPGDVHVNLNGVLHGGIVYTLCDLAGFAALYTQLPAGCHAATHDLHVSVMQAGRRGERIRFTGEVLRLGRSTAFLRGAVYRDTTLLASATITKTVRRPATA